MRIVMSWEEFRMIELLLINMKENAYKKEKGCIKSGDYEITWNPQTIIIELQGLPLFEKIILSLGSLEDN